MAASKVLNFPGFKVLYDKESDELVSRYVVDVKINAVSIVADQVITCFPHRFTQASLISELERREIGRPSTFEAITTKIVTKGYVTTFDVLGRECDLSTHTLTMDGSVVVSTTRTAQFGYDSGKLSPTPIGVKALAFVTAKFGFVPDYEYTAHMENRLDKIAAGSEDWQLVLHDLEHNLGQSMYAVVSAAAPKVVKDGKFGPYIRANGNNIPIKNPFSVETLSAAEIDFLVSLPLQYSDEETLGLNSSGFFTEWKKHKYSCTMTKSELLALRKWVPPPVVVPQIVLMMP
jgi:DNA topoisomerase-1